MTETTPAAIPQRFEPNVPIRSLTFHPGNPNRGDIELLAGLLADNGFAGAVLAQDKTGVVIDGEHRIKAAEADGMTEVPVLWLEVDDDSRDRLLASLNESVRRGTNDETVLLTLLTNLAATPRGLAGVPWDGTDLEDMARMLTPPDLDGLDGGHEEGDTWPSITIRAPHHVVAAWNERAKTAFAGNNAACLASLLAVPLEP